MAAKRLKRGSAKTTARDPRSGGPKPPFRKIRKQRAPGSDADMRPLADHGE